MRNNIMIGKKCIKIALLSLNILLIINQNCLANEKETKIIAMVIASESASEGILGMTAVACVIANRARAQHKTPYQIVIAKKQFYGYTAKNRHKLYLQVKRQADELAARIISLRDITEGALFYENVEHFGFPKWAKSKKITVKIKHHTFFR